MSHVSASQGFVAGASEAVPGSKPRAISLTVEDMHCGGCMRAVEKALLAVPGVVSARANLSASRVGVSFRQDACTEDELLVALADTGFKAAPIFAETEESRQSSDKDFLKRVAVAGFAAANIMLLSVSVWSGGMDAVTQELFHRLSAVIALPAVAYAGQPFFRSAVSALRGRRLNMDVPISLAVILATTMSVFQTLQGSEQVYFDAAVTLLFFLLIGRWLDQRLRTRAHTEAQNLVSLQNGMAMLLASDGAASSVPSNILVPGDRVLVAAGERVPADGIVLSGQSAIDQSLITGESVPACIGNGSPVYAGTLNLEQALTIEVTASDDMTLLAEIGRLMANAEQGKASYRRLADRAAGIYAPAVHILGLATLAGWLALGAGWEVSLTRAIAVLIVTCPCALALAVPAVQIAAASRLFRNGILLKSADALERLAEADAVVFDKTGTLTLGRPALLDGDDVPDEILLGASSLATASHHPYAKALVEAARARFGSVGASRDVTEEAGRGLARETSSGREMLGSAAWCGVEENADTSLWHRAPDGSVTGFRFRDSLREDAEQVVTRLESDSYAVSLLSGDTERAVEDAARQSGIEVWQGGVNPADKIAALERLGESHKVLMVGDGLNDAPALAQAHVSMSPATAADITQRAADLVFQGKRLAPVVEAISVARRARGMVFQNFGVALLYNAVFVPLAMAGYVTPLVAAIAMSTSSILVTANAMRLSIPNLRSRT